MKPLNAAVKGGNWAGPTGQQDATPDFPLRKELFVLQVRMETLPFVKLYTTANPLRAKCASH